MPRAQGQAIIITDTNANNENVSPISPIKYHPRPTPIAIAVVIHLRFANYERFFCCKGCLSGYKQKYTGRIESIKRKFDERE